MTSSLVTGGAGFIGFALASELARDAGHRVVVVDNFVRGERDAAFAELCARPNVAFVELDLAAPDAVARLPDELFDFVFHLAALNGTQNFYERPYEVMRNSTLPTFALVERYVCTRRVSRFVYTGSSEEYAATVTRFGWPIPTAEDVPLCIDEPTNPRWSYATSKLHGEVLTCTACKQHGVPFTAIRYHNVYGPRMGDKHVIPDFIARMVRGRYELHGHEDTRSFLYIDDAVDATLRLARAPAAADQIVNVGSDREIAMADLGELVMRVAGIDAPIAKHPSPRGSVRRRVPDLRKLRALIDFDPAWSLERGLARTVAWYRARLDGA